MRAFSPAGTLTLAASTTSTSAPLPGAGTIDTALVYNASNVTAFVTLDGPAATATLTGSVPIPPGGVLALNAGAAQLGAVILPSGTGTVYITTGTGAMH